jgi:F-type H+-transporting ATPase subunit c
MGKTTRVVLALLGLLALPGMVLASDGTPPNDNQDSETMENQNQPPAPHGKSSTGTGLAVGGACIGAGLAAVGGGYAIARVGGNCIEAMARQPEAAGNMFAPMIVTAAMIEGSMLFAIVVALMAILRTA